MPQGLTTMGNSILYAGEPVYREYEVLTATDMYPGRLVEADSTVGTIKAGADNSLVILGVLDVEPTQGIDDVYHAGDQARVIIGDVVVWLLAISGATIAVGTKIQCAGSGKVDQNATAYAMVGYALTAKSGADDAWILAKLTGI